MSAREEEWKPIPGFEGYYEVSNRGRVRGIPRTVETKNGRLLRIKGRELSQSISEGYPVVTLSKGGVASQRRVHTLVLEAFVGKREHGLYACHFDDVRTNNLLENLRYATPAENESDKRRNGNHHEMNKQTCPRGHLLRNPNLTKSSLRKGKRNCLACNRAKGYLQRKQGAEKLFIETANRYYERIMEGLN